MNAVINVEIEHDDDGKGIDDLLQARVHDDGTPFPVEVVRRVVAFSSERLSAGKRLYVHCQMGGSRSPAFAYAILRSFWKLSPEQALESIRTGRDDREYGQNPYHVSYMQSVERALA